MVVFWASQTHKPIDVWLVKTNLKGLSKTKDATNKKNTPKCISSNAIYQLKRNLSVNNDANMQGAKRV